MTDDTPATDDTLAEITSGAIPGDTELRSVSTLARELLSVEREIERTTRMLAGLKEVARQISEVQIPNRMNELGLSQFALEDGTRVDLKPFCKCSMIKGSEDRAIQWLRENGAADIIKNTVSVPFGRGDDERARALAEQLRSSKLPVEQNVTVNWQTMNAWVREELSRGDNGAHPPRELFELYAGQVAKLKQPE